MQRRRPGAQPGNQNARRDGLFSRQHQPTPEALARAAREALGTRDPEAMRRVARAASAAGYPKTARSLRQLARDIERAEVITWARALVAPAGEEVADPQAYARSRQHRGRSQPVTWTRPSSTARLTVELLATGIDRVTLAALDVDTATLTAHAVRIHARRHGIDALAYTLPAVEAGQPSGYLVAIQVIERAGQADGPAVPGPRPALAHGAEERP